MSKNVLLISPAMIKERTPVHDNLDEKLLHPIIKVCQDMFIHPLLGSALFNKIINDVDGGTITGDYKDLLDDYIIDCLCWHTLSKLVMDTSYQIWNKGLLRKQGENTEQPPIEELQAMSNEYRNRGEWYGERLRKYLIANSTATVLPEYFNGNTEIDSLNPSRNSFTMPIYLGPQFEYVHPDKNNCNCDNEITL